jgi:diguanylate cyclase (GGDEF)-like protein
VATHKLSEARTLVPAPSRAEALVASYRRVADVFHEVLSEQSPEALLERIADTLAELIPYDDLHIYEVELSERRLVPTFVRGQWADEVLDMRPAFGQGITGWAVEHKQPVLSNQAHLDPRVSFVPGTPPDPEALVCVPLIARGALKGALNVYRLGDDASFSEDEFELAKWFGDAAALAIDNAEVRAALELQAQTDSLTGLYNHRHFHDRLRAELTRAGRSRDAVALLMFDIDDFKRVNDICGHGVGDQILIAVADAARHLVRASDVICRLGGEEFAVIMPSCDAGDALGLSRRLMDRLEARPIDAAGEVTLSIGIAQGPQHAMNPRELVACAETAMMTAKARGKNRIVVFNEETAERPGGYDGGRDLRSIAHLKMLQSLAGKLSRLRDVNEIGEAIVNELRLLIDYHTCRVYLVEGDEAYPIAHRGDLGSSDGQEIEPPRVKLGSGLTGHVAASGRSLLVENALESDYALQIPGTDPIDESVMAAPLLDDARVVGVVFLSQLGIGQFDEDDLRLLEVLAGHVAVVLENARLYETMRREAENARAWLDFSDALSGAGSFDAICAEAMSRVVRLLDIDQCSLWLQDRQTGEFACAASIGYVGAGVEEITTRRHAADVGDRFLEGRRTPFIFAPEEVRAHFFARDPVVDVRGLACAPLPAGHGVRGWIALREPNDDLSVFTDDRLRLLDGMAYRLSMALQKSALYREQQESAQIASSLLEFARALVEADGDVHERIVEMTATILDVPETSLWLQGRETGEIRAVAVAGLDEALRERALAFRYGPETGAQFVDRPEPFVFVPADHPDVPTFREGGDLVFAIAPFRFDGDRMGFLIAGAPGPPARFDELTLKLLAGLADQAKLAL